VATWLNPILYFLAITRLSKKLRLIVFSVVQFNFESITLVVTTKVKYYKNEQHYRKHLNKREIALQVYPNVIEQQY